MEKIKGAAIAIIAIIFIFVVGIVAKPTVEKLFEKTPVETVKATADSIILAPGTTTYTYRLLPNDPMPRFVCKSLGLPIDPNSKNYAEGDVIYLLDNDGTAHPVWKSNDGLVLVSSIKFTEGWIPDTSIDTGGVDMLNPTDTTEVK